MVVILALFKVLKLCLSQGGKIGHVLEEGQHTLCPLWITIILKYICLHLFKGGINVLSEIIMFKLVLKWKFLLEQTKCFSHCFSCWKDFLLHWTFYINFLHVSLLLSGARKAIHELIFCSLLMDTEYKRQFAMKFTEVNYNFYMDTNNSKKQCNTVVWILPLFSSALQAITRGFH